MDQLLLLAADATAAHAFLVVVITLVVGVASATTTPRVEMSVEILKHHFFSVAHFDLFFFGGKKGGKSAHVFRIREPFFVRISDFKLDHKRAFLERISMNWHTFPISNF